MLAIIILVMGLLTMTALFILAWWLWFHDPKWPWMEARTPAERAPPSPAAPGPPVTPSFDQHHAPDQDPSQEVDHTVLIAPPPLTEDVSERRPTQLFVKNGPPTDRTQILPDMANFVMPTADEDAPMARVEQMQTRPRPVARAPRRRKPPQPPRS